MKVCVYHYFYKIFYRIHFCLKNNENFFWWVTTNYYKMLFCKYNYKLYEIQGIVEENIRAHIGLYLEMTSETHFCTNCYIDGAVFDPVLETILPEIKTVYDFKVTAQIVSDYCSIESTRLPEMMVERRN